MSDEDLGAQYAKLLCQRMEEATVSMCRGIALLYVRNQTPTRERIALFQNNNRRSKYRRVR